MSRCWNPSTIWAPPRPKSWKVLKEWTGWPSILLILLQCYNINIESHSIFVYTIRCWWPHSLSPLSALSASKLSTSTLRRHAERHTALHWHTLYDFIHPQQTWSEVSQHVASQALESKIYVKKYFKKLKRKNQEIIQRKNQNTKIFTQMKLFI